MIKIILGFVLVVVLASLIFDSQIQPAYATKTIDLNATSGGGETKATGKTVEVNLDFMESPDFKVYAFNALSGDGKNPEIHANVGDKILIHVKNSGKSFHAFGVTDSKEGTGPIIDGTAVGTADNPLKPGKGGDATFVASKPGEYYYICVVPGHRELGMEGKIEIAPSGGSTQASGAAVTPTGNKVEFSVSFVMSADFKQYAFNALPGQPGSNSDIKVKSGDTVTIHVKNDSKSFHAFGIVVDPDNPSDVLWNSAVATPDNPLKPGKSGDVTFVAGAPGTYYYICTVPGHAALGMVGKFIVEDGITSLDQSIHNTSSLSTSLYQWSATKNDLNLILNNSSPILGSKDAPITMIEFCDYQDFYCNKFYHTIEPDIVKNYINTGKVKMVFKDMVIIGQDSVNSANAAHCAQESGKFWEYHDTLYDNWSGENTGWASSSNLMSFANKTGLDGVQFSSCMAQSKYISTVQGSLYDAKSLGLSGTPDFFILKSDNSITKITGIQEYSVFDNAFKSTNESTTIQNIPNSTSAQPSQQEIQKKITVNDKLFQKIISKPENFDTNDVNKLVYKAKAYAALQYYVDAFNYYDKVLSIDPNNSEAKSGKDSLYNKIIVIVGMISDADLSLKSNPDNQTALDVEGVDFITIGRHDLALPYFERSLQTHPADATATGGKLGILFVLDKNEEFVNFVSVIESIPHHGEDPFLYMKSISLYKLDKYDEAISTYDEYLKTIPKLDTDSPFQGDTYSPYVNNTYSPLIGKAVMLENTGKSQDANLYYELYKQQDHQNDFYFVKGSTLMGLDKYQDAISNFDQVPTTSPNYEKAGYFKVIAQDKIAESNEYRNSGWNFLNDLINFFQNLSQYVTPKTTTHTQDQLDLQHQTTTKLQPLDMKSNVTSKLIEVKPVDTNFATIDEIPCEIQEYTTFNIHVHMDIFTNGQNTGVPARIGLENTCLYWLHTHKIDGIIHIESPKQKEFTVGEFFDIWKATSTGYPTWTNPEIFVNGNLVSTRMNDTIMHDQDEIVLVYGEIPQNMPTYYQFPQ